MVFTRCLRSACVQLPYIQPFARKGLWLYMRDITEPGLRVIHPVNTTVIDGNTLHIDWCVAFSLSVDIASWRGTKQLSLCGSQRHSFDDDGWLVKAEGNTRLRTIGYVMHYLYSMTTTLLPRYLEPERSNAMDQLLMMDSDEGLGLWLILPANPIVLMLLVISLTMTTLIGVCILYSYQRALWRNDVDLISLWWPIAFKPQLWIFRSKKMMLITSKWSAERKEGTAMSFFYECIADHGRPLD